MLGSLCSKYTFSAELKKHMFLSKDSHLGYKQEHVEQWCPERSEVVLERNASCKSSYPRCRNAHSVPNMAIQLS
jgi:hypothetical protein